jgi:hypothetical protein
MLSAQLQMLSSAPVDVVDKAGVSANFITETVEKFIF